MLVYVTFSLTPLVGLDVGFGFGIRPTEEPGVSIRKPGQQISEQEAIQRAKAELEATKQREKQLEQVMKSLEKEQQKE